MNSGYILGKKRQINRTCYQIACGEGDTSKDDRFLAKWVGRGKGYSLEMVKRTALEGKIPISV